LGIRRYHTKISAIQPVKKPNLTYFLEYKQIKERKKNKRKREKKHENEIEKTKSIIYVFCNFNNFFVVLSTEFLNLASSLGIS
jgi:hypothetical protein